MTQTDQPTVRELAAAIARDVIRDIPQYQVEEYLVEHTNAPRDEEYVSLIEMELNKATVVVMWPEPTEAGDGSSEPTLFDQVLGILSTGMPHQQQATAIRDVFVGHHAALVAVADAAVAYINAPDGSEECATAYDALEEAVDLTPAAVATSRVPVGGVA